MKRAKALTTGLLVTASFVACDKDPVGVNADPQLNIVAESVTVNIFTSASVGAVTRNTLDALQYVSRDQNVATVNALGAVTGVAIGSTYVVAALSSYPDARDSVRVRVYSDSCGGARPDFNGMATAEDRNLFTYDVNAPLNLQKTVELTNNGVEVSSISFSSPDGGVVTGKMWDPVTRSSLRPGILLMHGLPGSASSLMGQAQNYAQYGAVVIAIDAPWNHRAGSPLRITDQDRAEQIQVSADTVCP